MSYVLDSGKRNKRKDKFKERKKHPYRRGGNRRTDKNR